MSVRMALAKWCACTVGGAVIGAGAAHVAENPPQRPALVRHAKAAPAPRAYARAKMVKRVRRIARTSCIVRQPGRTITTTEVAYPPMPLPPLPPMEVAG